MVFHHLVCRPVLIGTNWLLVSEPGKMEADLIFGRFGNEMEDFEETGPEKETSGRDLAGGGDEAGEEEGNMS